MRGQKIRIAALALAALSFAPAGVCAERKQKNPEITTVMGQAMQRYADCIIEQAEALERSGEAAAVVASAAVSACRYWRDKTEELVMLNSMVNHGLKVESAGEVAQTFLKRVDERGRERASLKIIQIRAKNAARPQ